MSIKAFNHTPKLVVKNVSQYSRNTNYCSRRTNTQDQNRLLMATTVICLRLVALVIVFGNSLNIPWLLAKGSSWSCRFRKFFIHILFWWHISQISSSLTEWIYLLCCILITFRRSSSSCIWFYKCVFLYGFGDISWTFLHYYKEITNVSSLHNFE